MNVKLRPYQQEAVKAALCHFRSSHQPAVVVLPTGAGKSLVIGELARLARGKVLVLAHVRELVEQNHAKYESFQQKASIFSAGLGKKECSEQVTFGSAQSVAKNLEKFTDERFTLLIIDECHRVSENKNSGYRRIVEHFQRLNPTIKILGLTATPYRLGEGWIYQYYTPAVGKGTFRTAENRLFTHCLYELPLAWMVRNHYLTPVSTVDAPIEKYDFSRLKTDRNGCHSETDLNRHLKKEQRATKQIITWLLAESEDRRGVMIFASTIDHAKEIIGYLPASESALVIGETESSERDQTITDFKSQIIKYLVNVSVLTTGFDAPHVDLIAILRPTESVSLYQQMVGRGLRLAKGKTDCLVIDFAGNRYNIFSPEPGQPRPDSLSVPITVPCPACGHENSFWGLLDEEGNIVEHYGRRCGGVELIEGQTVQCDFRYRFKECGQCGAENDIAARSCHQCNTVLVDPDTRLREALNLKDCLVLRCSGMTIDSDTDRNGERLKITYHDEDGAEVCEFFRLDTSGHKAVFYHKFGKQALINRAESFRAVSVAQIVSQSTKFRKPDFVVAQKKKRHYWSVMEKIYDYNGSFRKAPDAC